MIQPSLLTRPAPSSYIRSQVCYTKTCSHTHPTFAQVCATHTRTLRVHVPVPSSYFSFIYVCTAWKFYLSSTYLANPLMNLCEHVLHISLIFAVPSSLSHTHPLSNHPLSFSFPHTHTPCRSEQRRSSKDARGAGLDSCPAASV